MSLHSYNESKEISARDWNFDALIMAALRKADTMNAVRLRAVFPEICHEMEMRYNAPGGKLVADLEREYTQPKK